MVEERGHAFDVLRIDAALSVGKVGLWEWDVRRDQVRVSSTTAALFGFAHQGETHTARLAQYTQRMHRDDQPSFKQTISEVVRQGGLFMVEYRTVPAPDDMRWVLSRGYVEHDDGGACSGRGIVIDITDFKTDGFGSGRALFAQTGGYPSLDRFAAWALEGWQMLSGHPTLKEQFEPVLRQLLTRIGYSLASSVDPNKQPALRHRRLDS